MLSALGGAVVCALHIKVVAILTLAGSDLFARSAFYAATMAQITCALISIPSLWPTMSNSPYMLATFVGVFSADLALAAVGASLHG